MVDPGISFNWPPLSKLFVIPTYLDKNGTTGLQNIIRWLKLKSNFCGTFLRRQVNRPLFNVLRTLVFLTLFESQVNYEVGEEGKTTWRNFGGS